MNPEFWHKRWADNQIGFHESAVNPLLVAHLDSLALPQGARVFVPLCGKTLDIDWLLSRGYRVAGAELSTSAVAQLLERLGVKPAIHRQGGLERHCAPGLDIFVGDIFQLTAAMLGTVDAVYDRAALIALPPDMRGRYVQHLRAICGSVPQLLITLDYDQSVVDGPPFSVSAAEVRERHPDRAPQLLSSQFQPMGLKGRFPVTESVWKLD
jgi:thiopurine S-methyltransferase